MSKTHNDPLRKYLQERWRMICECNHCFDHSLRRELTPIEVMLENGLNFARHTLYDCPSWSFHVQWPVLNYVADFVLINDNAKFAIECDGHDFHERTKQQAAHDRSRDRAMTEAGWKVMRFTGSEIWRNPMECAHQIVQLALNIDVAAHEAAYRRGDHA